MSEVAKSLARTKRWTRLEYERLVDLGAFGPGDRLELLGGQLVVREPQGRPPHLAPVPTTTHRP